jgi:hypothetical protein
MERTREPGESLIGKICRDDCGRMGLVACIKHTMSGDTLFGIHVGRTARKPWQTTNDPDVRVVYESAEQYVAYLANRVEYFGTPFGRVAV